MRVVNVGDEASLMEMYDNGGEKEESEVEVKIKEKYSIKIKQFSEYKKVRPAIRELIDALFAGDKQECIKIGIEIDKLAGFAGMRAAWAVLNRTITSFETTIDSKYHKTIVDGFGRLLDYYWDGIGEWMA